MENILIVNLTGIIYSGPVVIAMGSKINEYMMKILLIVVPPILKNEFISDYIMEKLM